jgi:uncharacterized membrane protein (UPF0127 family)
MRTDTLLRRDGRAVAVDVCTGPLERARGLLGRSAPAPGLALWIAPCRAVHTWGMRYPIDVAFLDERGLILKVVSVLAPRRFAMDARAASVLEFRAGECARLGVKPGERLVLPSRRVKAAPRGEPLTRDHAVRVLAAATVIVTLWMLAGCRAAVPSAAALGSTFAPTAGPTGLARVPQASAGTSAPRAVGILS